MSKKRQFRAPRQSLAIPQGAVALDDVQQQRQLQEVQMRQRVEAIASAIYADNVDVCGSEAVQSQLCQLCFDAALVFAKEAWGIQGRRVRPSQISEAVSPPRPIQSDQPLHPDIIPLNIQSVAPPSLVVKE